MHRYRIALSAFKIAYFARLKHFAVIFFGRCCFDCCCCCLWCVVAAAVSNIAPASLAVLIVCLYTHFFYRFQTPNRNTPHTSGAHIKPFFFFQFISGVRCSVCFFFLFCSFMHINNKRISVSHLYEPAVSRYSLGTCDILIAARLYTMRQRKP